MQVLALSHQLIKWRDARSVQDDLSLALLVFLHEKSKQQIVKFDQLTNNLEFNPLQAMDMNILLAAVLFNISQAEPQLQVSNFSSVSLMESLG